MLSGFSRVILLFLCGWVPRPSFGLVPQEGDSFSFKGCLTTDIGFAVSGEGGCKFTEENTVWVVPQSGKVTYSEAYKICDEYDNGWDDWSLAYPQSLRRISGIGKALKFIENLSIGHVWSLNESNSKEAESFDLALESDNALPLLKDETALILCTRVGFKPMNGEGCSHENSRVATSTGGCRDIKSKLTVSLPSIGAMVPNGTVSNGFELRDIEFVCSNLDQGGYTDWRNPNLTEFRAIEKSARFFNLKSLEPKDPFFFVSPSAPNPSNSTLVLPAMINIRTGAVKKCSSNPRELCKAHSICVRGKPLDTIDGHKEVDDTVYFKGSSSENFKIVIKDVTLFALNRFEFRLGSFTASLDLDHIPKGVKNIRLEIFDGKENSWRTLEEITTLGKESGTFTVSSGHLNLQAWEVQIRAVIPDIIVIGNSTYDNDMVIGSAVWSIDQNRQLGIEPPTE